jgi:hypothetical protein
MKGSNTIYNTIPKSQEWLIIKKLVNIIRGVLPRFYFFKRKKLKDDFTKLCKPRTHMAIQKRAWMICFLFKSLSFFNLFAPSGMFFTIKHLLIMGGHGCHVNLKANIHKSLG